MRNILKFRNKWTNGFLSPKPTWHENQHDMTVKIGLLPQKESRLPTINFHSSETGWAQIYGLFLQASNKIQHTSGTYPQTQKKPPVDWWKKSWTIFSTLGYSTWMYLGPLFHGVNVGIFEHFNPSKVHPKRFGHRKLESEEVLPLLPWPLRGCRWGLSSIAHILISANGSKLPWFPYNNCSYCWWFRNPANQLRLVVYLQGFVHLRWCRISSINGSSIY